MPRRVNFVFDVEGEEVTKQVNVRMNELELEILDGIVRWMQETKEIPGFTFTRQDAIMLAIHELDRKVKRYASDKERKR